MNNVDIALVAVIVILFLFFMIHQEFLFGRMIRQNEKVMKTSSERLHDLTKQNNTLLSHADERLAMANKIVHDMLSEHTRCINTLASSADSLAVSITDIKDMMLHIEKAYTTENAHIMKNRDEYKDAYGKLLKEFEVLRKKLQDLADEDHRALKELARRPTIANNNLPQKTSLT